MPCSIHLIFFLSTFEHFFQKMKTFEKKKAKATLKVFALETTTNSATSSNIYPTARKAGTSACVCIYTSVHKKT